MKTLDLKKQQVTVDELLESAAGEAVLIRGRDGNEFVIEAVDAFDREVTELAGSAKFMAFLAERSKEQGTVSLEEVERRFPPGESHR
jgi:hypothetical protein